MKNIHIVVLINTQSLFNIRTARDKQLAPLCTITSLIYLVLKGWFCYFLFRISGNCLARSIIISYCTAIFLVGVHLRQQKHNLQALNNFCHFRNRVTFVKFSIVIFSIVQTFRKYLGFCYIPALIKIWSLLLISA